MKRKRLFIIQIVVAIIVIEIPTSISFVEQFQNCRIGGLGLPTFINRFDRYKSTFSITQLESYRPNQQQQEDEEGRDISYPGRMNGNENDSLGPDVGNYVSNQEGEGYTGISNRWQQSEGTDPPGLPTPPTVSQSPDRAVNILSELKSNAALFAAFAYGSLNLPGTLTVSESKVTSVTTSLSISRPLPDSDLIRTFVVLDICTLCLMISCVAASQLLIYRLTDGSYEDVDEYESQENKFDNTASYRKKKNSRDSALGRLVTTYRNEFTVARITFDLGLVTLLLAVGVRSIAIFDEDIVVPVAVVLGVTAFFLAVAYVTTYVEVFRTAENLPERPLFSIAFPFLTKGSNEKNADDNESDPDDDSLNQTIPQIFFPISLASIGLGLFLVLTDGSVPSESSVSRLGPYDVTSGAIKLRVVTDKIDSEKVKLDAEAKNQRKKRAELRAADNSKKARAEKAEAASKAKAEAKAAKKRAIEEEAKKKAEIETKKKAEEDAKKKAEIEAKRKAEEEAKKKAEQETKPNAEEEAKQRVEQEAKAKAEEEAKKAEEEMKKRLEEEAKKKAIEEANASAEASKKKAEEAPLAAVATTATAISTL